MKISQSLVNIYDTILIRLSQMDTYTYIFPLGKDSIANSELFPHALFHYSVSLRKHGHAQLPVQPPAVMVFISNLLMSLYNGSTTWLQSAVKLFYSVITSVWGNECQGLNALLKEHSHAVRIAMSFIWHCSTPSFTLPHSRRETQAWQK